MKWYRGKKRLAKKLLGRSYKLIMWALNVKPGDYIGTCDGCNRKVDKIDYIWRTFYYQNGGKSKTAAITEVRFQDTLGYLHCCPGGGCAFSAETPEEVTNYFKYITDNWTEESEKSWGFFESNERLRKAFKEDKPIVDEFGELLPEFNRKTDYS